MVLVAQEENSPQKPFLRLEKYFFLTLTLCKYVYTNEMKMLNFQICNQNDRQAASLFWYMSYKSI